MGVRVEIRFSGGGEISIKGENFLGMVDSTIVWNNVMRTRIQNNIKWERWVEEGERENIFEEESGKFPICVCACLVFPNKGGYI